MQHLEYQREGYTISTDPTRLDLAVIHTYLSQESYWAQGRSMEIVQRAAENSLNFGVYSGDQQVGYARLVTDYATFAWLADVFILPEHRGRGLSKWLVQCVLNHPDVKNLRRFFLATRDAHELYRVYGGFQMVPSDRFMERIKPD
jgi:N-acetylglutamate synthase-like GNAT family acetyltransferase